MGLGHARAWSLPSAVNVALDSERAVAAPPPAAACKTTAQRAVNAGETQHRIANDSKIHMRWYRKAMERVRIGTHRISRLKCSAFSTCGGFLFAFAPFGEGVRDDFGAAEDCVDVSLAEGVSGLGVIVHDCIRTEAQERLHLHSRVC